MKWYFIFMGVMMLAAFGSLAVSEHSKHQCQQECAHTSRSAQDCQTLCR